MDNKYGLVLDGDVAVGKFVFTTDENDSGQREILKLDLNATYVDISNGHTKTLRCLLVEKIPKEQVNDPRLSSIDNHLCINVLEDLGVGIIMGKFMMDNQQAHYQKATFVRTPKKLNPKLN